MSRQKVSLGLVALAIVIGTLKPGAVAQISSHIAHSFATAAAAPLRSNPGDVYFNTATQDFFGSKTGSGAWTSLTGGGSGLSIGAGVGGGTIGSLLFVGGGSVLAQDNSNIFWDAANHRLGIDTASPAVTLDLHGAFNLAPTANLTAFNLTGFANTGSNSLPSVNITGTFNTSGSPWGTVIDFNPIAVGDADNSGPLSVRLGGTEELSLASNGFVRLRQIHAVAGSISIQDSLSANTFIKLIGGGGGNGLIQLGTIDHGDPTNLSPGGFTGPDVTGRDNDNWYLGPDGVVGAAGKELAFVAHVSNTNSLAWQKVAFYKNTALTSPVTPPVWQFVAANGSQNASAGGAIFDHFTDVSSVSTGETDLYSDTVSGGTLAVNGMKLTATYAGTFVNSSSAKRLRIYFGGTNIFDSGALTVSATAEWVATVSIIRDSSTSVRCSVNASLTSASAGSLANYVRVTGLTLTSDQVLKITGTASGAGAASGDVVASMGVVNWTANVL